MNSNVLTLHRVIDMDLFKEMQVETESFELFYDEEEEDNKSITVKDIRDTKIYLGEVQEYWDPNIHNLDINRKIIINHPEYLFGANGVASDTTELGIAFHVHSKTSGFQKIGDTGIVLTSDAKEAFSIEFNYDFPPASIKGEVNINLFVYVKSASESNLKFADEKGVELGVIDYLQFIVDGDGSTFPIVEVERPGKSLWQLVMKWNDVTADPFDVEYVRVEINKSHYMYDYIFKDTKPSAFLLSEIMSNVMAQVIYNTVNDDSFTDTPDDTESIANVVSYWISTYEVDTSSLENISYSLRNKLEDVMDE